MSFDFELSDRIDVSGHGETDVGTLTLNAVPAKIKHPVIKLKQMFFSAQKSMAKELSDITSEEKPSKDEDVTGEAFVHIFYMGGVDMVEAIDKHFKMILLSHDVCKLPGGAAYTAADFDKTSASDIDRLFGEYLNHFFASSWGMK